MTATVTPTSAFSINTQPNSPTQEENAESSSASGLLLSHEAIAGITAGLAALILFLVCIITALIYIIVKRKHADVLNEISSELIKTNWTSAEARVSQLEVGRQI